MEKIPTAKQILNRNHTKTIGKGYIEVQDSLKTL